MSADMRLAGLMGGFAWRYVEGSLVWGVWRWARVHAGKGVLRCMGSLGRVALVLGRVVGCFGAWAVAVGPSVTKK